MYRETSKIIGVPKIDFTIERETLFKTIFRLTCKNIRSLAYYGMNSWEEMFDALTYGKVEDSEIEYLDQLMQLHECKSGQKKI